MQVYIWPNSEYSFACPFLFPEKHQAEVKDQGWFSSNHRISDRITEDAPLCTLDLQPVLPLIRILVWASCQDGGIISCSPAKPLQRLWLLMQTLIPQAVWFLPPAHIQHHPANILTDFWHHFKHYQMHPGDSICPILAFTGTVYLIHISEEAQLYPPSGTRAINHLSSQALHRFM